MKIAYIVPSLIKSGPIKVVHQLVEELSKKYTVEIFYFKVPDREKLIFGVPTYQIKFQEPIDFDTYDIIHSHTILADAYVWFHRNKIKQAKTVTTLHNYAKEDLGFTYGKYKSFFLLKIWQRVISRHDQIVVLSKDAVKYYEKLWHIKNITFVYNGINKRSIVIPQDQKKEKNERIKIGIIASAGGVNFRKGIDQIIQALPKLDKYQLYIAGKETEESIVLKQLAKKLGVLERICFLGYVDDMSSFLEKMDLFIVPPRSEGFSLALQEIVRHRKPVICSDIPIFRELFSEKEVSFFGLNNTEDVIRAITEIEGKEDVLVANAYQKFLEKYTTEKMAENYLKAYEELISGEVYA